MSTGRGALQLTLAATSAVLAALLIFINMAPLPEIVAPTLHLERKPVSLVVSRAVSVPPIEAFAEIDARPMFSPSRKPIPSAGDAQTHLAPPDVKLVGIILDAQEQLALLRTQASPLAVAFRLGSDVQGWKVSEINPDGIVLSAGGERNEIRLDANPAPAVGNPAPPAADQPTQPVAQTAAEQIPQGGK